MRKIVGIMLVLVSFGALASDSSSSGVKVSSKALLNYWEQNISEQRLTSTPCSDVENEKKREECVNMLLSEYDFPADMAQLSFKSVVNRLGAMIHRYDLAPKAHVFQFALRTVKVFVESTGGKFEKRARPFCKVDPGFFIDCPKEQRVLMKDLYEVK